MYVHAYRVGFHFSLFFNCQFDFYSLIFDFVTCSSDPQTHTNTKLLEQLMQADMVSRKKYFTAGVVISWSECIVVSQSLWSLRAPSVLRHHHMETGRLWFHDLCFLFSWLSPLWLLVSYFSYFSYQYYRYCSLMILTVDHYISWWLRIGDIWYYYSLMCLEQVFLAFLFSTTQSLSTHLTLASNPQH